MTNKKTLKLFQYPVFWAFGDNYPAVFDSNFDNRASSARFSGDISDFRIDSINMYEFEYFMGREQYYYGNSPAVTIDNLGR